jgi:hypothetical protein
MVNYFLSIFRVCLDPDSRRKKRTKEEKEEEPKFRGRKERKRAVAMDSEAVLEDAVAGEGGGEEATTAVALMAEEQTPGEEEWTEEQGQGQEGQGQGQGQGQEGEGESDSSSVCPVLHAMITADGSTVPVTFNAETGTYITEDGQPVVIQGRHSPIFLSSFYLSSIFSSSSEF